MVVDPGVVARAGLAGGHVPLPGNGRLVIGELTGEREGALVSGHGFVQPRVETLDILEFHWIPQPLEPLLDGDNVHVLQTAEIVQKLNPASQSMLVFFALQPCCVCEKVEWSAVANSTVGWCHVVAVKIIQQQLVGFLLCRRNRHAVVQHGTWESVSTQPGNHRNGPESRV